MRWNWRLPDWLEFGFDADRIAALVIEAQVRLIAGAALVIVTRDLADLFDIGALISSRS